MAIFAHTQDRLLIVEDDARLRAVLGEILSGWEVALAGTARDALDSAARVPPSVALVDLGLPDMDGALLIKKLIALRPGLPVVVLTVVTLDSRILEAIRAGARGYLFKEDVGQASDALKEAIAGGAPMSRAVARLVFEQLGPPSRSGEATELMLTDREREVVAQLARGLTYDQLGRALGVTANTIRSHIRAIYEKLAVSSRTEAVMVALRLGLVRGPSASISP